MKLTVDELHERAASLDDLASHPAWAHYVDAAQRLFGEAQTLGRIAAAAGGTERSAESVALTTVEMVATWRTMQHLLELPARLAKDAREKAIEATRRTATPDRRQPFGPDVEVTT